MKYYHCLVSWCRFHNRPQPTTSETIRNHYHTHLNDDLVIVAKEHNLSAFPYRENRHVLINKLVEISIIKAGYVA